MHKSKNQSAGIDKTLEFVPLRIAILIISDTRTLETDTSGVYLSDAVTQAEHIFVGRTIVIDDVTLIRSTVQSYIDDPNIDVVITSGGTGLTQRDVTPEAVMPLVEKTIDGFSILFHQISFLTIGLSTLQSRAFAGLSNNTLIYCLPGSTGAVRDGWEKIISPQLDARYQPCNSVGLIHRD